MEASQNLPPTNEELQELQELHREREELRRQVKKQHKQANKTGASLQPLEDSYDADENIGDMGGSVLQTKPMNMQQKQPIKRTMDASPARLPKNINALNKKAKKQ